MGIDEKLEAKADQAAGKVKQGFGDLTDDEQLEAEGRGDAVKGHLKEAWGDAKDAAESGWDKVKDAGRNATS